jgi:hypothetical protein
MSLVGLSCACAFPFQVAIFNISWSFPAFVRTVTLHRDNAHTPAVQSLP